MARTTQIMRSRKTFTTSRGLTYAYRYHESDSTPEFKPAILFLHGFPSLAVDFQYQITHFSSLGYVIIAPDLIGYGESSRPKYPEDCNHKLVAKDLIELLDNHSIQQVIGISHDFGAQILTRLELYHPTRVERSIFLTIGPITIGQEFDLDKVNAMTREMMGFEGFGYQDFLTRDPEATHLLATHSSSFHDLMFTTDHELWKDNFRKVGGLKQWLLENRKCETIPGYKDNLTYAHEQAFNESSGGYEGAKNWYLGFVNNLNIPDDETRLKELGMKFYQLPKGKKVLLVTAGRDVIAAPEAQEGMTRPYLSDPDDDLTVKKVDAAHWVHIEKAGEVNNIIEEFLK